MLVFASSLDTLWNDLPLKPSFVLFMHQTARYLARYNAAKAWYTLGEGIPIVGTLDGGVPGWSPWGSRNLWVRVN